MYRQHASRKIQVHVLETYKVIFGFLYHEENLQQSHDLPSNAPEQHPWHIYLHLVAMVFVYKFVYKFLEPICRSMRCCQTEMCFRNSFSFAVYYLTHSVSICIHLLSNHLHVHYNKIISQRQIIHYRPTTYKHSQR